MLTSHFPSIRILQRFSQFSAELLKHLQCPCKVLFAKENHKNTHILFNPQKKIPTVHSVQGADGNRWELHRLSGTQSHRSNYLTSIVLITGWAWQINAHVIYKIVVVYADAVHEREGGAGDEEKQPADLREGDPGRVELRDAADRGEPKKPGDNGPYASHASV